MEKKIRINSGTLKIEVNDDGEYIMLPVSDDSFTMNFYRLMEDIQKKASSIQSADITSDSQKVSAVEDVITLEKEMKEDVDKLFGPETCRKVFGDILPSVDLFVEFFGSLVPFMEEYKNERLAKMEKYNANRVGSVI